MRFRYLLLLPMVLTAALPVQGETIGRLFFTPAQRATLERLRQNPNLVAPTVSDTLTINGMVQRHGGETTVWINGVPQRVQSPSGARQTSTPPTVPVPVPGRKAPARLKAGQTLDTTTGTIREHFQAAPRGPNTAPMTPNKPSLQKEEERE